MTYFNTEVLCDILPEVFPNKDVTIAVVESLVLAVVFGRRVHSQVSQTRRVRVIIDRSPEIFVSRKLARLVEFPADEQIDRDGQGLRHAVRCFTPPLAINVTLLAAIQRTYHEGQSH